MSNWRINFGVGPLRYVRALGSNKKPASGEQQKMSPLGCLITLVVVVAAVWLCCTGAAALYNSQP
ncbi:hypothetical protein M3G91_10125 [Micromonospora chalcea]|uniref:hypothetical protein n=1 Tax=Micromonospora chalcea TaxID=1874 RepID=UPI0021A4CC2D|nr:hypothetical protein [Micromonospora chalcea]MCT2277981.1 hypothetical protein [Micromonospora chalcea]